MGFNKEGITKEFLGNIGLIQNILGAYSQNLIYNERKEKLKKILSDVYGYKDISRVIPPELDKQNLDEFLKTMFWNRNIEEIKSNNKS